MLTVEDATIAESKVTCATIEPATRSTVADAAVTQPADSVPKSSTTACLKSAVDLLLLASRTASSPRKVKLTARGLGVPGIAQHVTPAASEPAMGSEKPVLHSHRAPVPVTLESHVVTPLQQCESELQPKFVMQVVGERVGEIVGSEVLGDTVGESVGSDVGAAENGEPDGYPLGDQDGNTVGDVVGGNDGVGPAVGATVGDMVG